MADNPGISAMNALRTSKSLMMGQKGKLFLLSLSFIGWSLLCILSLGIGFLWLIPYMQTAIANFYDDLKNACEQKLEEIPVQMSSFWLISSTWAIMSILLYPSSFQRYLITKIRVIVGACNGLLHYRGVLSFKTGEFLLQLCPISFYYNGMESLNKKIESY